MTRRGYAVAAGAVLVAEVGIALFVRDRWMRPYGGDVLAVIGVYLVARAVTRWRWPVALAAALGVAVLIEVGQAVGVAALLGFERGSAGEVVLGSGFDWWDLLAYLVGGVVVAVGEGVKLLSLQGRGAGAGRAGERV